MRDLPERLLPPLLAITGALATWCFIEHGLGVCFAAAILAPWGCWLMREDVP